MKRREEARKGGDGREEFLRLALHPRPASETSPLTRPKPTTWPPQQAPERRPPRHRRSRLRFPPRSLDLPAPQGTHPGACIRPMMAAEKKEQSEAATRINRFPAEVTSMRSTDAQIIAGTSAPWCSERWYCCANKRLLTQFGTAERLGFARTRGVSCRNTCCCAVFDAIGCKKRLLG